MTIARSAPPTHASSAYADWRDYLALTKPRVMSLVVFTALTGLIAAPGDINPILAMVSLAAIAVGAGASGALNMAYDADIDAVMGRTQSRPVPSGRVTASEANALGLVLSVLSVMMLALAGTLLAAGLLAFTIFFYAVVYTRWLKRWTPQNIVIGGLAGALPPAIGWAAVTGEVGLAPLSLVLVIFIWTPPHFWALCLLKADEYAAAGVPMLPNTHGVRATRWHIFWYAVALWPLGMAPAFVGAAGGLYGLCAFVGGAIMVWLAYAILRARIGDPDRERVARPAVRMFVGSIGYLFALFAAVLVEQAVGIPPISMALGGLG